MSSHLDTTQWKELRAITPARKKPPAEYKIPLVIHQSHKSRRVPQRMADNIQHTIDQNPEFEHRYYDDEAVLDYIETHGDKRFNKAFHKLAKLYLSSCKAFQSDLFRYLLLEREGGVWLDADVKPLSPLLEFIFPDDQYVTVFFNTLSKKPLNPEVAQNRIITTAAHPFVSVCLDNAVEQVLKMSRMPRSRDIFETTGPPALRRAIEQLTSTNLRVGAVYADTFEFSGQNFSYRFVKKFNMISKYDGYIDDLRLLGETYWMSHGKRPTVSYGLPYLFYWFFRLRSKSTRILLRGMRIF